MFYQSTFILKFTGKWYAFYHNSELSQKNGEFNDWLRSICVDRLEFNKDGSIKKVKQTGVLTGPK
ncbi:hypothetical protein [Sphingobacterium multivorum]|uniref:hypothetical protein n=1 Tax=Sphingobacterium multivorum TaxID=28454 RepID=UPI0031BB4173